MSRNRIVALRGTSISDNCKIGNIEFSTLVSLDEADGLLYFCGLGTEILTFDGPKAWYIDEPITMSHFRTILSFRARLTLGEEGFFHHTNPNPKWRVLSPTHCGTLDPIRGETRRDSAVALVSNYGGRFWWAFRGNRLRNRFILHKSVSLYGTRNSWLNFRRWPWTAPHLPPNYKGELNQYWWEDAQVNFLSQFKVAVCMENSLDSPNYFTEKFVNAARAGCVPIFHATPEVRKNRLQGAKWVDPEDFDFNPEATLIFALNERIEDYQLANDQWLKGTSLEITHRTKIWERIAELFMIKFEAT